MNITRSIATAALLPLAVLTAGNANAFFGDFTQETDGISITSSNFNSATLLNEVKVVCPNAGWLLAQADATFQLDPTVIGSTVWIRYSITNDGANGIDSNHDRSLQAYVMESVHEVPGSIMRMDRCSAGEEVSYRFVAQRVSNADSTTAAFGARMHVQFFRREI
ncbi:MAG: hypothetical protein AAGA68_24655 [Pseudomonadota bacterium]